EINTVKEEEKIFSLVIYNDRCIHCAQCVDSCPTKAMQMDEKFEISNFNRHNLKMDWEFVRAAVKPKAENKS
ncbi:MAG: 4Fe-4S dicluster domain-containing protein, partial [Candidatus Saccharicenans sp.]|nr:4Fe-4S dicluster domain-containing protein [Candidatus Saccharicenans sp.]